jgi:hypothetical protein
MIDSNILIGFEYCENEEIFIGSFKNEESLFNYTKRRLKTDTDEKFFDLKRKTEDKRLDWGMDCTFKSNYYGRITKYGYKISTIHG